MFGKLGDIANMMKQAKELQGRFKSMQEEIASARYEAQSGGGAVTAVVNGKLELVNLKIAPDSVKSGDVEMLEDLITAAVAAAQRKAGDAAQQEMSRLTGGMSLPGLDGLLGGGTL